MFKLNDKEQTFFLELTERLVRDGFQGMDIDVVASFYNQDKALRFCDADGPFHKGWDEYSVWLNKIFSGFVRKQKFKLRDTYSFKIKDDVVTTTTIIDNKTLIANGDLIDSAMRLSFIWAKEDEEWKIVHEHFSVYSGELAGALGYFDTGKQEIDL